MTLCMVDAIKARTEARKRGKKTYGAKSIALRHGVHVASVRVAMNNLDHGRTKLNEDTIKRHDRTTELAFEASTKRDDLLTMQLEAINDKIAGITARIKSGKIGSDEPKEMVRKMKGLIALSAEIQRELDKRKKGKVVISGTKREHTSMVLEGKQAAQYAADIAEISSQDLVQKLIEKRKQEEAQNLDPVEVVIIPENPPPAADPFAP